MMMDPPDSGKGRNVDKPAFRTPLHAFLTGSEFMSKFDEGNYGQNGKEWPQEGADTNGQKYDNTLSGKAFHSTFEMGDMNMSEAHDDESKFSCYFCSYCSLYGLYSFCSDLFLLVDVAEKVKRLNQSISTALDEVSSWLVKSPPAQKTVPDSPSASRCRAKMRSLEDQMNKWRSGIGKGNESRQWSTGGSSVVSQELPSLVDYDEPDESDHSRRQRGGGLEVHYESTAAENNVEAPIIVGRLKNRSASVGSLPLETFLYRPEECCEAGPNGSNGFRSKEANEIELPTVPAAEFTPLPCTTLEGSVTSFQIPKADYLEAASPVPRPAYRRASMGSVPEDYVKPIESYQMMGSRRSPGTINWGLLSSPRSAEKRRLSLGSGKVDIIVGRRPSGVSCDESYSSPGTGKHGGSVVSRRESVGSITDLLVREGSRSSVSTGLHSCDVSRASVGTGLQSSDASRASVGSWVSPKSVIYLRNGSRPNAGKTHHAPIGSPGSVYGSIDSRKGCNDSYSTILTGDSSMYRGSKARHTPIGSPTSVTEFIGSRKNANDGYRERIQNDSCSSEGKGINAPLGSPGSVAGCIDIRRGADGSRRQRSPRKLSIDENPEAPSRIPSFYQTSPSTPRSTKKRHGSGSKRDLPSKDHDAESSPRALRSGKNVGSRTSSHGSENGTDPDTSRSSRRKHSGSERKKSMRDLLIWEVNMISEVEEILSSPLSSKGKKSRRSDSTRHRSSRKLDSKESGELTTPRSQRKERMGAGGSSTYYSEVEAYQLRGLKKSRRRASTGADPSDVSVHNIASERASRRQERSHRASVGSLADGNVEEARRRKSSLRRSSVGSLATDSVEGMQRRQSRRASMASIPADKAHEKHRRQGRSTVIDGEAPAATPRSNLDSSLSKLDKEHVNSQRGGDTKKSQHSVMSGSLGAFLSSDMSGSYL
jgi:hypothetical protein